MVDVPLSCWFSGGGGGVPEITVTLDQQNSPKPFLHTRILNRRLNRPIFGWEIHCVNGINHRIHGTGIFTYICLFFVVNVGLLECSGVNESWEK